MNKARTKGTLEYFKTVRWSGMRQRCSNTGVARADLAECYKSVELQMTKDEFYLWCDQRADTILAMRKPSIDRISDDGHYSIDNIQVLEFVDNVKKSRAKSNYLVQAKSKDGVYAFQFMFSKCEENGFSKSKVCRAIQAGYSHRGYLFSRV